MEKAGETRKFYKEIEITKGLELKKQCQRIMPFLFYFVLFVFQDKLSLCSPGYPGTHWDYIHHLGKEQCLSRHLHIF